MATKRVFNPGDQPVVIDDEGRILGGGEWADLDIDSDLISSHLEREQLLVPADIEAATAKPDSKPSTTKTKE